MNKDVKYLTPKRSVKEIHGTERRAASAQAVAELMFVKAAQEQQLDETTIAEYPDLFVEWDANWRGKQGDIVQRADDALTEKRTATENADKLINLDAMKIQIGNIRQQYLQKLVVVDEPDIDTVTMSRSAVCHTMKLQSEADIDEYIAEVKRTLMDKLNGHDVLHII